MGTQLRDIVDDIDLNILFGAVKDVTGGKPKMTDAEMREVMQGFMKEMQTKVPERASGKIRDRASTTAPAEPPFGKLS